MAQLQQNRNKTIMHFCKTTANSSSCTEVYCRFISIFIDNKIKIFVYKYFVVFSMNTTTCIKYHVHFHLHYNFRIQLTHLFDPRVGPPSPKSWIRP